MLLIAMTGLASIVTRPAPPRVGVEHFSITSVPVPPVVEAARAIARSPAPMPVSVDCMVMRSTGVPETCLPADRAARLPAGAGGADYASAQRDIAASDPDAWAVRLAYGYRLRFDASVPSRKDAPGVLARFTVSLPAAVAAQEDGPTIDLHEIVWEPKPADDGPSRFPAFALAMELVTRVSATCRIQADLHPFCHDAVIVDHAEAGGVTTPLTPFQEWQLHDAMLTNVYQMRAAPLTRSGSAVSNHSVVLRQIFRLPG